MAGKEGSMLPRGATADAVVRAGDAVQQGRLTDAEVLLWPVVGAWMDGTVPPDEAWFGASAATMLGSIVFDQGKEAEAEALWTFAAQHGPPADDLRAVHGRDPPAEAAYQLTKLYYARGRYREAAACAVHAAERGHALAAFGLAQLAEQAGKREEMEHWLDVAAEAGYEDAIQARANLRRGGREPR